MVEDKIPKRRSKRIANQTNAKPAKKAKLVEGQSALQNENNESRTVNIVRKTKKIVMNGQDPNGKATVLFSDQEEEPATPESPLPYHAFIGTPLTPIKGQTPITPKSPVRETRRMTLKEYTSLPKMQTDENITVYAARTYKLLRRQFNYGAPECVQAIANSLELPECNTWAELSMNIDLKYPTDSQIKEECLKLKTGVASGSPFRVMHHLRVIREIMVAHYDRMPSTLEQFKVTVLKYLPAVIKSKFLEAMAPFAMHPFNRINFELATDSVLKNISATVHAVLHDIVEDGTCFKIEATEKVDRRKENQKPYHKGQRYERNGKKGFMPAKDQCRKCKGFGQWANVCPSKNQTEKKDQAGA